MCIFIHASTPQSGGDQRATHVQTSNSPWLFSPFLFLFLPFSTVPGCGKWSMTLAMSSRCSPARTEPPTCGRCPPSPFIVTNTPNLQTMIIMMIRLRVNRRCWHTVLLVRISASGKRGVVCVLCSHHHLCQPGSFRLEVQRQPTDPIC